MQNSNTTTVTELYDKMIAAEVVDETIMVGDVSIGGWGLRDGQKIRAIAAITLLNGVMDALLDAGEDLDSTLRAMCGYIISGDTPQGVQR